MSEIRLSCFQYLAQFMHRLLSKEFAILSIFFENPQWSARHCIKLTRNAKEWLQHHMSPSAYNTHLQHRHRAHLAQTQPKNGEEAGHQVSKPRHSQLQQHDQPPKLPKPTYHIIRPEEGARDWQGVAKLRNESTMLAMVYIAPRRLTP